MKPKLIILVGLPASGKSTKAKEIVKNSYDSFVIVSSDAIREEICEDGIADQSKNAEVFQIFHKRIKDYLKHGQSVIADATNISMKSRRAILENIKNISCEKICIVMATKYQNCIANNMSRSHAVPVDVLWSMMKRFQVPFYEEGFDRIEFIQDDTYSMNEEDAINILKDYNQQNPYHSDNLLTHSRTVAKAVANNVGVRYLFTSILHDIGKPFTRTVDEENIAHYYGHANVGAYIVMSNPDMVTDALECELFESIFLINYHMEPFNWNDENSEKMKQRYGEDNYEMLLKFNEADKGR